MVNKKCPPNTFCFSWGVVILILMLAVVIWFLIPQKVINEKIYITAPQREHVPRRQREPDIFLNPYVPPQKPIMNTSYSQLGILTDKNNTILALFGKPHHTARNKWTYYTMSDRNVSVKLPVIRNGKSCTGDYGCDEIMNGENVYVHGYNDVFNVLIYDNSVGGMYNPFV
jgi:hypothetical protein